MAIQLGIWAPVRGTFVQRRGVDDPASEASFEYVSKMVRRAEELDFDTVLVLDHWLNSAKGLDKPIAEAVTTTAALAAVTERIELMLAYRPAARHPAVMAKMGANIDNISGGRFAINVVSGWYAEEHTRYGIPFPEHDRRHVLSLEAVDILRGLWTQPSFTYGGEEYKLEEAIVSPAPVARPHPPIYFGGESEAGKATAARAADIYLMNGRPLEEAKELVAEMRERAAAIGRELRFGISSFVICERSDAAAQERLERLLEESGGESKTMGKVDAAVQHIQTSRASKGVGSNGGIAPGLIGSPETIAARMRQFEEAGIETFLLQFDPPLEGLERFAAEVAPLLRTPAATAVV